ncbi:MAG: DUF2970 domain-containing protein [Burkholderiaceae bacterium]|nr:DUF2970 domain-containing protein [Burkholderiaceae bacterium]
MSEPRIDNLAAAPRKSSFLRTVRAIAWSFFGVRRNSAYKEDLASLNPFHVIITGIAGAVLLVIVLIVLVNWVVGAGPRP